MKREDIYWAREIWRHMSWPSFFSFWSFALQIHKALWEKKNWNYVIADRNHVVPKWVSVTQCWITVAKFLCFLKICSSILILARSPWWIMCSCHFLNRFREEIRYQETICSWLRRLLGEKKSLEQARGVYRNLLGNELNWLSIAEFIIIIVFNYWFGYLFSSSKTSDQK